LAALFGLSVGAAFALPRSDALTDAFATLIDERELSERERLVTIAAIKEASRRTGEEYEKFREEQGLRG